MGKGDGRERKEGRKKAKKEKEKKVLFHFFTEQLLESFYTYFAILAAYFIAYNRFLGAI